jgi:hypothetical protein
LGMRDSRSREYVLAFAAVVVARREEEIRF